MSADADGLRQAILDDTDDALAWSAYADWLAEHSFDRASAHVRAFREEPATLEGLLLRHILLESSSHGAGPGHTAFRASVHALWDEQVTEAVAELIGKYEDDLFESDAVSSAIAATHATRYRLSRLGVSSVAFSGDACEAAFTFSAQGVQEDGRTWAGDSVTGSGAVEIRADPEGGPASKSRRTVVFSDVVAEVDHGDLPEWEDVDGEV